MGETHLSTGQKLDGFVTWQSGTGTADTKTTYERTVDDIPDVTLYEKPTELKYRTPIWVFLGNLWSLPKLPDCSERHLFRGD